MSVEGSPLTSLIAAFFAFTGRIALAGPLVLMALAVLGVRGRSPFPGFGIPGGFGRRPSAGQSSEISTRCLRMVLDHDSGAMSGQILDGPHRGADLATLTFPQLIELYNYLENEDDEGATLLATYLERERAEEWHGWQEGVGSPGAQRTTSESAMTVEEAHKILGLEPDASAADVKSAHKKLMKKMHPDQGGSTYLASKINRAKEILLEATSRRGRGQ